MSFKWDLFSCFCLIGPSGSPPLSWLQAHVIVESVEYYKDKKNIPFRSSWAPQRLWFSQILISLGGSVQKSRTRPGRQLRRESDPVCYSWKQTQAGLVGSSNFPGCPLPLVAWVGQRRGVLQTYYIMLNVRESKRKADWGIGGCLVKREISVLRAPVPRQNSTRGLCQIIHRNQTRSHEEWGFHCAAPEGTAGGVTKPKRRGEVG